MMHRNRDQEAGPASPLPLSEVESSDNVAVPEHLLGPLVINSFPHRST